MQPAKAQKFVNMMCEIAQKLGMSMARPHLEYMQARRGDYRPPIENMIAQVENATGPCQLLFIVLPYKSALTNLEIALAADGIKPGKGGAKIYKALETEKGVQRAMDKIKELCTDPKGGCVFWSAGAQPPELLVSGEVVMATGWNGRFFNAEVGEGAPIVQVWDGQGLDYEYFVQVKGGPNDANGMAKKALAMMTSTEMLAGSAKYIAYAPWRKSSIAIMEAGEPWYKDGKTNMVPQMPTAPA